MEICTLLMVSGRGRDEGCRKISTERLNQYKGGRRKKKTHTVFKKVQYSSEKHFHICQMFHFYVIWLLNFTSVLKTIMGKGMPILPRSSC